MSKSWTPEELAAASAAMKAEGNMSYEEFCAALEHTSDNGTSSPSSELQPKTVGKDILKHFQA